MKFWNGLKGVVAVLGLCSVLGMVGITLVPSNVIAAVDDWGISKISYYLNDKLLASYAPPSVSTGFGTSASILRHNGTAAFRLDTGSTTATSGVIQLATASNGWNCWTSKASGVQAYDDLVATPSGVNQVLLTNYVSGVQTAMSAHTYVDMGCTGL